MVDLLLRITGQSSCGSASINKNWFIYWIIATSLTSDAVSRMAKKTDKESQLGLLRTYLLKLNDNRERLMSYKQRHGFGRYWTYEKFGIQNMCRTIRHTICKDGMYDIDMKNAHLTLLSWYCHKHEIPCGPLDDYIKNREPMMQDLMDCRHIVRDEAKTLLLAIMNGK